MIWPLSKIKHDVNWCDALEEAYCRMWGAYHLFAQLQWQKTDFGYSL